MRQEWKILAPKNNSSKWLFSAMHCIGQTIKISTYQYELLGGTITYLCAVFLSRVHATFWHETEQWNICQSYFHDNFFYKCGRTLIILSLGHPDVNYRRGSNKNPTISSHLTHYHTQKQSSFITDRKCTMATKFLQQTFFRCQTIRVINHFHFSIINGLKRKKPVESNQKNTCDVQQAVQ